MICIVERRPQPDVLHTGRPGPHGARCLPGPSATRNGRSHRQVSLSNCFDTDLDNLTQLTAHTQLSCFATRLTASVVTRSENTVPWRQWPNVRIHITPIIPGSFKCAD